MLLRNLQILALLILTFGWAEAQELFRVKGRVTDAETSETLIGASVFIDSLGLGTTVNIDGVYEITVPTGTHRFTFSLIGYKKESKIVDVLFSQVLDVALSPISQEMDEVEIKGKAAEDNVDQTETGVINISKRELDKIPYLLGEADPLRALQMMPGVQTAGEGNTGFYVRGGAIDQNLILLDHSVVYNPSHLFGFFSVFNGSTVSELEMNKGGIPSYYGGRISSITRVQTRAGSQDRHKGEAGVGLVAANALVEGPVSKKGSYLFAARRSYVDLFMKPLREVFSFDDDIDYYFYDLNLNLDYELSDNDELSIRSYYGKDDFNYVGGNSFTNDIRWGNTAASASWRHRFNNSLFGTLTAGMSKYRMEFAAGIVNYSFQIFSDIVDYNSRYQLDWLVDRHELTFGAEVIHHRLRPNHVSASATDVDLALNNNVTLNAGEAALFVNDRITLNEKWTINAGLRLSAYQQRGPFTRFEVDENLQLIDTVRYSRNEQVSEYMNVEPRISVRYLLNEQSSIKGSFDRLFQYMHMAPLSSASLPMDVWVPSSEKIKPQRADQYSLGYFRNISAHSVEASAVAYYKTMSNQIEYRDGVIIGYSKGFNYDDNFVFGKGKSYGIELLAKKSSGRINGLVSYTLSRTLRTFEELNDGKQFPAKYDRLHDLSILANYEFTPTLTLSMIGVYATGNALNLPIGRYVIQGNVVHEYGDRNAFRMPAYHRLDFALTWIRRKTETTERAWIFSVYNAYNRRNPYYIYFESKGDIEEYRLETNLRQVSLFPVLPSVTYRLKF